MADPEDSTRTAPIQVTAALIPRQGRLFIAQRPPHKSCGLFWEFPGGKKEKGESLEKSLSREINEELCWDVRVRELFHVVHYDQPGLNLDLYAFWCSIEGGTLCLKEHVAFEWVLPQKLHRFKLTGADQQLIPLLLGLSRLPTWDGGENFND